MFHLSCHGARDAKPFFHAQIYPGRLQAGGRAPNPEPRPSDCRWYRRRYRPQSPWPWATPLGVQIAFHPARAPPPARNSRPSHGRHVMLGLQRRRRRSRRNLAPVGDDQHGLKVAQILVHAPVLGQIDAGPRQLPGAASSFFSSRSSSVKVSAVEPAKPTTTSWPPGFRRRTLRTVPSSPSGDADLAIARHRPCRRGYRQDGGAVPAEEISHRTCVVSAMVLASRYGRQRPFANGPHRASFCGMSHSELLRIYLEGNMLDTARAGTFNFMNVLRTARSRAPAGRSSSTKPPPPAALLPRQDGYALGSWRRRPMTAR